MDVVVIGAGAVGENLADRAGRGGLDVVLVERELVGGECSYWACMPSKALLLPGHALAAARRLPGAAAAVTGGLDAGAVLGRRDTFASGWDDSSQAEWVASAGIGLLRGSARLTGERRVEVDGDDGGTTVLTARHAVAVCTGSVPSLPDVEGLAGTPHWTSREATSAQEVPASLAVVGGGVVAVELAQAWQRLGARVSVLARSGLLGGAEPFAGELVGEALAADGVDVRTGTSPRSVRQDGDGVVLDLGDGATLRAERLLVATGRTPAVDGLGLESVGLTGDGPLEVDDSGRVTGVPGGWLYAAGDVTGRAPLTHQGKYAARAAGDAIAARARGDLGGEVAAWSRFAATADHRAVPQVVFTDPEVAWVGLTAAQAGERGLDVRAVDVDLAGVAGAGLLADGYAGRARLVVDESRRVVVGATFAGQGVAELLHSATIAVVGEVPLDRLWHAVPSYPTVSEVWLRLLEGYGL
ncbi:dihydrolipoamide dehydrogenase [Kineococcus xinjiangensis]|uniref:Dihydrolipoamide dehydrogenase n=1 Tax=Kineococcus xinjiangensis TaxID=512762 RepID=A0A2S6IUK9_9ACTN|nr:dihydrolipoamide dehydrogenase [Kineococcus xinjiangensis]